MKSSGLKFRLIKLQLTLTIIILTISWSFITINDYKIFKNLSLKNFETTARVLSRNLSPCLDFQDIEECQRVLNTLEHEADVLEARVFDKKNAPVSVYLRDKSANLMRDELRSTDKYHYEIDTDKIYSSYPILESNEAIGRLFIVYKFEPLSTFISNHALYFLLVVAGSILLAIVLSNHFQEKITSQINSILKTIKSIRDQKNYKLRTVDELSGNSHEIDEFKQFAISFDEMIEQIEIKDSSLRMRNEDLKRLVEEKVDELYREKEKSIHSAELASLGEMAGGIAHEINNPLAIIRTTATVLKKGLKQENLENELFNECVTSIEVTVDRIAKIVNGLKNLSRRTEDEERVHCTLREIFDDVFAVAAVKNNSKSVEIRKHFSDEDLKTEIHINRIQLSQVLINLINNAFDAISEQHEKWILVYMKFEEEFIVMKITDSGNGIPQHIQEKMFNPFFTTKEIGKGTGLGLSISKSMIEKNGGKFFYDEEATNTSFVIHLPY